MVKDSQTTGRPAAAISSLPKDSDKEEALGTPRGLPRALYKRDFISADLLFTGEAVLPVLPEAPWFWWVTLAFRHPLGVLLPPCDYILSYSDQNVNTFFSKKNKKTFFQKSVDIFAGMCYHIVTGRETPERKEGKNHEDD